MIFIKSFNKKFGLLKILWVIIFIFAPVKILEARDIYVRLSNAGSYTIGSTKGNLFMSDAEGNIATLGDSAKVVISNGHLKISEHEFNLPVKFFSENGLLKFNKHTYRGTFLIPHSAMLLNVLDVESYLCGVLPAEVGATWDTEALRAQAIIARTYALHRSMSRAERGYDVVDTDADQVYSGAGVETAKSNNAVASTRNQIITYKNTIAFTPFHSDSGGHTANIADVWGQNYPYLMGVPEAVEYKSPVSNWNVKIASSKIQSVVKKITGHDVGNIISVQVSEIDNGGRAVNLKVIGSRGEEVIKAAQFRSSIGARNFKSTMLVSSAGAENLQASSNSKSANKKRSSRDLNSMNLDEEQLLAKMTADGVFTTDELIDMLTNPDTQKQYYSIGVSRANIKISTENENEIKSTNNYRFGFEVEKSGKNFIFYGKGWGHGVGLSQWGMLEMARQGWTAEKILMHYYPGTAIRKFK